MTDPSNGLQVSSNLMFNKMMEYTGDTSGEMTSFWEVIRQEIDGTKADQNVFKGQELPLARIKKIMKLDDDVKSMMISAEAPILFAKAAEIFIRELTLRAWIHTERNRRRTLHRNDIAMAVSDGDTDQFDFLIDIVPRDDARAHRKVSHSTIHAESVPATVTTTIDASKLSTVLADTAAVAEATAAISAENGATQAATLNGGTTDLPLGTVVVSSASVVNTTTAVSNGISALQLTSTPAVTATSTAGVNTAVASSQLGSQPQIQYVFQLPSGAAGNAAAQSLQLQMFQPSTTSTDGVAVNNGTSHVSSVPPSSIIQQGPNGALQFYQVVTPQAANVVTTSVEQNGATTTTESKVHAVPVQRQQQQVQQQLNPQPQTIVIQQQQQQQPGNSASIVLPTNATAEQGVVSTAETVVNSTVSQQQAQQVQALQQQQVIYTPAGSNQPLLISLSDAIAAGLIAEIPATAGQQGAEVAANAQTEEIVDGTTATDSQESLDKMDIKANLIEQVRKKNESSASPEGSTAKAGDKHKASSPGNSSTTESSEPASKKRQLKY